MSCRWSFEGSLARNAFLRDSRCTKPYVFPYKVRPQTSMIYLCGATVARRSRVWSDHVRIMLGSCSDRFRIVNGVSPVFRACAVDRIPLWFATVGSFPHCKWGCKWCWWMSCRWYKWTSIGDGLLLGKHRVTMRHRRFASFPGRLASSSACIHDTPAITTLPPGVLVVCWLPE